MELERAKCISLIHPAAEQVKTVTAELSSTCDVIDDKTDVVLKTTPADFDFADFLHSKCFFFHLNDFSLQNVHVCKLKKFYIWYSNQSTENMGNLSQAIHLKQYFCQALRLLCIAVNSKVQEIIDRH